MSEDRTISTRGLSLDLAPALCARSRACALPQRILWDGLDNFILATEEELLRATRLMIETTKTLVEPAGAASLAAALKLHDRLQADASRSSARVATSARRNSAPFWPEGAPRPLLASSRRLDAHVSRVGGRLRQFL